MLEVVEGRFRRVVTPVGRQGIAVLEHMHMGVDRALGQGDVGFARVTVGRNAISDVAVHGEASSMNVVFVFI